MSAMKRERMIRLCSMLTIQNKTGYFIRENDFHAGDIPSFRKLGYEVYAIRQLENRPFTVENRTICDHRVGIAVFARSILFPKRKDMARDSIANYFTLNNQYSYLDNSIIKRDFKAAGNLPKKD